MRLRVMSWPALYQVTVGGGRPFTLQISLTGRLGRPFTSSFSMEAVCPGNGKKGETQLSTIDWILV